VTTPTLEIPTGAWGRGIERHTFVATDDAVGGWFLVDGTDPGNWPPLAPFSSDPSSDAGIHISRQIKLFFEARYRAYYLTFDTSSIGLNRRIIQAQLRLYVHPTLGTGNGRTILQDGLSIANDFFVWGSALTVAFVDSIPPFSPGDPTQNDYSEINPNVSPPGLDGLLPATSLVLGGTLLFPCRPAFVERQGLTQYVVSLTGQADGSPPTFLALGQAVSNVNNVRIRPLSAPAEFHPTLEVLTVPCVTPWGMMP